VEVLAVSGLVVIRHRSILQGEVSGTAAAHCGSEPIDDGPSQPVSSTPIPIK
jgi:hypothetical protein